ncbi:hypothetical protein [Bartonella sp. CB169]|uniref:hypothetical protein n=1 Tax=Bartonella sp. CB169 TaxID=3112257 RepID=UPI00300E4B94
MIVDRALLALWAVMLAFFCVSWLGSTHILSRMFPVTYIGNIADILFFFLSTFFAVILYWKVPQPMSWKTQLAALLPPVLILFFLTVF